MTIAPGLLPRPHLFAFALACGFGPLWFAAPASPPPPLRPYRVPTPPPLCIRSASAIESLGPTRYRVSRHAFAQLYRASQTVLPYSELPMVPALRGIRIYAVAPFSLGFANGDLVERVNAIPMISPDRMLEIYSQLWTTSRVPIDLQRGAVHVHLVYDWWTEMQCEPLRR